MKCKKAHDKQIHNMKKKMIPINNKQMSGLTFLLFSGVVILSWGDDKEGCKNHVKINGNLDKSITLVTRN